MNDENYGWIDWEYEPFQGSSYHEKNTSAIRTLQFELHIQIANIVDVDTECVVNAANERLAAGGGVCDAIFGTAGYRRLEAACNKIGHCDTGSAVITPGFDLKSKYIIHAVGPRWNGGKQREERLLYSAYQKSLELAKEHNCHSITFPLISAGIYGYPMDEAWDVALKACVDFVEADPNYYTIIKFAVLDDCVWQTGSQKLHELHTCKIKEQFQTTSFRTEA